MNYRQLAFSGLSLARTLPGDLHRVANARLAAVRGIAAGFAILAFVSYEAAAEVIHVVNPSFESPFVADGVEIASPSLASQATHAWEWQGNGSNIGIRNPSAIEYPSAAGAGTPQGADGSQVAYLTPSQTNGSFGTMQQGFAGPDEIFGNDDDPRLLPRTIYTVTVSVGRRMTGIDGLPGFGGHAILWITDPTANFGGQGLTGAAGSGETYPAGAFIDVSLSLDTRRLPASYLGKRFGIRLSNARGGNVITDYDNVRVEAQSIPEPNSLALLAIAAGLMTTRTRTRR